jgi:hypothetical protein
LKQPIDSQDLVIYDVNDIQRIFKCGKRQAYNLMNSATFPSFRINTKHYITKEKLEKWAEKQAGKNVTI